MKKFMNKDMGQTVYSVLFAISFAHLLNDMMQSVIPSIYPMLKEKYGFSFGQIGIMTLMFQLSSSILQPLVGLYSDRHPHPYSLSTGMMFTFTGIIMLSFADSFATIVLAVAVIGMGSSIFHPESSRIAQMAGGQRRGLAQSIFQVGGNGGSAVGPLLAAVVILPLGQESIAWFAIAALIAGSTLLPVGSWYKRQLHRIRAKAVVPNPAVQTLSRRQIRGAILMLCILTFSKYFYMASMTSYFTFFLIDKFGVSIQTSQLCLFAFLASVAVGRRPLRAQVCDMGLYPRCCALCPCPSLHRICGDGGSRCHHRPCHILSLLGDTRVCHRTETRQDRYDGRAFLRP